MTNNNTAKVTFTYAKDGSEVRWDFNEAAQARFGKGKGLRLNIGTAYLLANKDERETFVSFMGQGAVRRGLLVLAKGRHTSEADAKKAATLAESLRTSTAAVAA